MEENRLEFSRAMAQGVAEIRALTGWLLDEGCPSVGLLGFSFGGWFAGLTACRDPANPHCQAALLKLDTFAELHAVAPTTPYSKGWVMRGITRLATGDAAPAVTYRAGWFIRTSSWAIGTQPGDTGRSLWHGGRQGMSLSVVCIAPEIDFAVLVACNHGIAAWKTFQTVKALIRTFAPKRTS
jgi:pimeloyl-ACP methyl ester carboxylesterase